MKCVPTCSNNTADVLCLECKEKNLSKPQSIHTYNLVYTRETNLLKFVTAIRVLFLLLDKAKTNIVDHIPVEYSLHY